jgi:hypothetical protein
VSPAVRWQPGRIPAVSMRRCRLIPSTFFAPLNPRGPATGVPLTELASTTAPVGRRRRPAALAGLNPMVVPWTGFDLINYFNAWKKTEDHPNRLSAAAPRPGPARRAAGSK